MKKIERKNSEEFSSWKLFEISLNLVYGRQETVGTPERHGTDRILGRYSHKVYFSEGME